MRENGGWREKEGSLGIRTRIGLQLHSLPFALPDRRLYWLVEDVSVVVWSNEEELLSAPLIHFSSSSSIVVSLSLSQLLSLFCCRRRRRRRRRRQLREASFIIKAARPLSSLCRAGEIQVS